MNIEDVLKLARGMELHGMEFYEKSASGSDGEIRDLFNRLAGWEKGHAQMVKEEMGRIISRNALDLGFYPFE